MDLVDARCHAQRIISEQVAREPAKSAVSEEISVLGTEEHIAKNEIVKEKKRSGEHRHHYCGADQMPAQGLEVIEKTHFLFFFFFFFRHF
jgi:hypothetical protein